MKKKVLKVLVGEAYDKETGKNFPVYQSYWANDDGSYSRTEKVFVSEVEVQDRSETKPMISA